MLAAQPELYVGDSMRYPCRHPHARSRADSTELRAIHQSLSINLTHWQPQASFADDEFKPEPPPGAKQVPTFPTSCGATH
jgi:hypothetical protein